MPGFSLERQRGRADDSRRFTTAADRQSLFFVAEGRMA